MAIRVEREILRTLFNVARFAVSLDVRRGNRGLRQAAAEINQMTAHPVSASTLSRYERGAVPELLVFVALCDWMGISPSVFFSDADEVADPLPFPEEEGAS